MHIRPQCRFGGYSDQGLKPENQDSMGFSVPEEDNVLQNKGITAAIADGVSGCDEGKEASACSIQSMVADYYCTADSWTVQTSVQKVLIALNRWMYEQGIQAGRFRSMATTLSVAIFKSTTAHIFHIGDSRIYLLRDKQLQQLTQDHIWATAQHKSNQLTRAIGLDLSIDIDYRKVPMQNGDIFIFTTDGVHEYISDEQMVSAFMTGSPLKDCQSFDLNTVAEQLVKLALKQGSPDNLSCQIVHFEKLPKQDAEDLYQLLTELPFPPELEVGMKLDGYRIVREIHSSKRVQVYQAVDEASGQAVVLKTPSVNYLDDPVYLDLFTHEEWVGKRLKHPNVMKLFTPSRPKHFLYVVSEYIDGQTLRDWLQDYEVLSLNDTRAVAKQIALGLQAMHRLEMVHQDVKPENIIRDKDGCIKLIDFGSTKVSGVEEITTPLERIHILGTKNYAAPEYFSGQKGTSRSDIFSLGVIVYEMLTGHLPYGEKNAESRAEKLSYTPVRHWQTEIPIWVDKAIEKAVHPNPEYRYRDCLEFIHDLSHPNSSLLRNQTLPLIERNPVAFWRGLSIFLLLAELITLANC
jgi:serine/threonine protein phosphatase PrpC